jgi:CRP/FNR family transcriptional regulator
LFNDLRYPAWVESSPNTDVAVIPGTVYKRLFSKEENIQDMTVKALSTVVFRLMNELEQIHSLDLGQRLADLLLNNASSKGEVKMTQQNFADHLGTSREVIARLMQKFVQLNFVSTGRGVVFILNENGLVKLLRSDN